jgi:sugar/nucleoside kinase (ribokinase family)
LQKNRKTMKVLGVGNALVDVMTMIPDDNFLTGLGLPKGSMQLVDKQKSDEVMQAISGLETRITSGGSAANTINGLASMKVETGFIGTLGRDELGNKFISDFHKNKVAPHVSYSETHSGKAIALVSPDGERTFATYLGAAVEMGPDQMSAEIFSRYNIVHIEGYLLQNYDLIEAAVKRALSLGVHTSLDLASFNVVDEHKDFLLQLIPKNIDILFANEEEAHALTGLQPEEAVLAMGEMVPLAIVKTGSKGSLIYDRKSVTTVNAVPSQCIDTTGAGDLYASGFLYGMILGEELSECGRFGSVLAGHVIRVIGAKIHDHHWNDIFHLIHFQNLK